MINKDVTSNVLQLASSHVNVTMATRKRMEILEGNLFRREIKADMCSSEGLTKRMARNAVRKHRALREVTKVKIVQFSRMAVVKEVNASARSIDPSIQ